jgi:hypothetical protein
MLNSGNTEHEMERAYGKPSTSHKIGHCENASGSPENNYSELLTMSKI